MYELAHVAGSGCKLCGPEQSLLENETSVRPDVPIRYMELKLPMLGIHWPRENAVAYAYVFMTAISELQASAVS